MSNFSDFDASNYQCLGGLLDISQGVTCVFLITVVCCIISAISFKFNNPAYFSGKLGLLSVGLEAVLVWGVFYGFSNGVTWYYFPYFVFMAMKILYTAAAAILSVLAILQKNEIGRKMRAAFVVVLHDKYPTDVDVEAIITFVIVHNIISIVFDFWFYTIIYESFQFVKDMNNIKFNSVLTKSYAGNK